MSETTTEKKPHIVKAGGTKGTAIVALLTEDPSLTRQQLAAEVGCTVGRVGEVIRWLRENGTPEEQAVVAKSGANTTPRRAVAQPAPQAEEKPKRRSRAKAAQEAPTA